MGTTNKKYDITLKKKAIDLYFKQGMGYKVVAKELDIERCAVRRWVKKYEAEGIQGLVTVEREHISLFTLPYHLYDSSFCNFFCIS